MMYVESSDHVWKHVFQWLPMSENSRKLSREQRFWRSFFFEDLNSYQKFSWNAAVASLKTVLSYAKIVSCWSEIKKIWDTYHPSTWSKPKDVTVCSFAVIDEQLLFFSFHVHKLQKPWPQIKAANFYYYTYMWTSTFLLCFPSSPPVHNELEIEPFLIKYCKRETFTERTTISAMKFIKYRDSAVCASSPDFTTLWSAFIKGDCNKRYPDNKGLLGFISFECRHS